MCLLTHSTLFSLLLVAFSLIALVALVAFATFVTFSILYLNLLINGILIQLFCIFKLSQLFFLLRYSLWFLLPLYKGFLILIILVSLNKRSF